MRDSERGGGVKNSFQMIRTLLRTEKGARQARDNQYLFSVQTDANKIEIRKAVEEIYKVKVQGVNTVHMPGKLKRVRSVQGHTPDWKKAVVTLKTGHKIDLA